MLDERRVGSGGEPVIVHLHSDRGALPPTILDDTGQKIHRMTLDGLHVVIGITHNAVVMQPGCAPRSVRVLPAPIPDRLTLGRH